jgi:hypothetical protein
VTGHERHCLNVTVTRPRRRCYNYVTLATLQAFAGVIGPLRPRVTGTNETQLAVELVRVMMSSS